ncbi:GNAT family N-acetyltransferase [Halomonas sp. ISL-60]|uniref:GNAT family N-acetyltransferase n=1 Tax=unclassified Halomonas TaxID=2609666 RepID=UPI0007D95AE5|nr:MULTISPECIES: GNAT family N-acetyltransferase [unclassified Halomonas]MBT2775144.1 GNAT family N-acetyltransferase [Halomonas sp. ISL-60]MBT2787607.1 GNAT family N-acetyltransferase [Halomonas sp. ISL-106]MBT2799010.1 GNAT family N-acetyltransferase [Halomonas sp. ISL-104]MBT2803703.1 GNAT family N-acetyltransferase [Halomonas sp. ISL-56]OAL61555.1 GCN5 family acetyltransferase [Halomonas sp. ALS9]
MTSQHPSSTPKVMPCPPDKRREALLQLAAAHNPKLQAALSAAVKAMYNQPDAEWEGLWVTLEAGQLTAAIWVQRLPMNMAQLWLPKTGLPKTGLPKTELPKAGVSRAGGEAADLLLDRARQWVKTQNIRLCHLELSCEDADTEGLLLKHAMQRLVCLAYLTGSSDRRLAMNEAVPLSLQPFGGLSQADQLSLLAAVGQDSLDSRPLRDVLSVKELLAGFYQQVPQAPQHWYAVGYQGAVVGVLLLAPRPALGRWELMLMGLTPDWRGRGLGRSLLNKALELAQQAGVQEMVLGVDEVNLPAKRLYQQAGFVRYAQQRLLAWKGGGEKDEAPK